LKTGKASVVGWSLRGGSYCGLTRVFHNANDAAESRLADGPRRRQQDCHQEYRYFAKYFDQLHDEAPSALRASHTRPAENGKYKTARKKVVSKFAKEQLAQMHLLNR